jgi:hypothetical protein
LQIEDGICGFRQHALIHVMNVLSCGHRHNDTNEDDMPVAVACEKPPVQKCLQTHWHWHWRAQWVWDLVGSNEHFANKLPTDREWLDIAFFAFNLPTVTVKRDINVFH